jgi:hypothetical protein
MSGNGHYKLGPEYSPSWLPMSEMGPEADISPFCIDTGLS